MTELHAVHYAKLEAIPRFILEKRRQIEMSNIEDILRKGQPCNFKMLILEEDNLFIAHSLEFGLTADGNNLAEVEQNLIDIIQTQINYCFENDNLDNLFKTPASLELWAKFWNREIKGAHISSSSQKIIYNYKK